MCEQGSGDVDFPPFGLDRYDSTDYKISYLRGIPGAQRLNGEEFVSA